MKAQSSKPLSILEERPAHLEKPYGDFPLSCPQTSAHKFALPGGSCPYNLSLLQCVLCKLRVLFSPLPASDPPTLENYAAM